MADDRHQLPLVRRRQRQRPWAVRLYDVAPVVVTLAASFLFAELLCVDAQSGDFDWDIAPLSGYPIIAFDQQNSESEVQFRYSYSGTLGPTKALNATLYQYDCLSPADTIFGLTMANETVEGSVLVLDVDVLQETVKDTVHYTASSQTTANIAFCMRVDYNYVTDPQSGESTGINFHETKVDITVNLVANFTLEGISVVRDQAASQNVDAQIEYPLMAYYCDDTNSDDPLQGPFVQGSIIQVCVKVDDTDPLYPGGEVYVEDILSFVVTQPDGPGSPTSNIQGSVPDILSSKDCNSLLDGICNVKTQLLAKYFVDPNPNDLRIDGVALLALGSPIGLRRKLVAIRGSVSSKRTSSTGRELQVYQDGTTSSDFGIDVTVVGNPPDTVVTTNTTVDVVVDVQETSTTSFFADNMLYIGIAVGIFLISLLCIVICCCCCGRRRERRLENERMMRQRQVLSRQESIYLQDQQEMMMRRHGQAAAFNNKPPPPPPPTVLGHQQATERQSARTLPTFPSSRSGLSASSRSSSSGHSGLRAPPLHMNPTQYRSQSNSIVESIDTYAQFDADCEGQVRLESPRRVPSRSVTPSPVHQRSQWQHHPNQRAASDRNLMSDRHIGGPHPGMDQGRRAASDRNLVSPRNMVGEFRGMNQSRRAASDRNLMHERGQQDFYQQRPLAPGPPSQRSFEKSGPKDQAAPPHHQHCRQDGTPSMPTRYPTQEHFDGNDARASRYETMLAMKMLTMLKNDELYGRSQFPRPPLSTIEVPDATCSSGSCCSSEDEEESEREEVDRSVVEKKEAPSPTTRDFSPPATPRRKNTTSTKSPSKPLRRVTSALDIKESKEVPASDGENRCWEGCCLPLMPPVPPKFQGDIKRHKRLKVPHFDVLVNYPQNIVVAGSAHPDKYCVMCNKESSSTSLARHKGVCSGCIGTVWEFVTHSNSTNSSLSSLSSPKDHDNGATSMQLKYCKGCREFRHWAAFGDRGHAGRCKPCRLELLRKQRTTTTKTSGGASSAIPQKYCSIE